MQLEHWDNRPGCLPSQIDNMSSRIKVVLVVEDEPSFSQVLTYALESWGYRVFVAGDGAEALALYDEANPDLVLSDIVMPNLDGLGLLRALKRKGNTPVVLFTAYASLANAISAIREGAVDMLTKPIDFARLRAQLEAWLAVAQTRAAQGNSNGGSHDFGFSPSSSGSRPPESNLTIKREQRPQGTFQNAGFSSLPGGRLSAPGPTNRGR
jgi:DNA-binding response OmpR family regulator